MPDPTSFDPKTDWHALALARELSHFLIDGRHHIDELIAVEEEFSRLIKQAQSAGALSSDHFHFRAGHVLGFLMRLREQVYPMTAEHPDPDAQHTTVGPTGLLYTRGPVEGAGQ